MNTAEFGYTAEDGGHRNVVRLLRKESYRFGYVLAAAAVGFQVEHTELVGVLAEVAQH